MTSSSALVLTRPRMWGSLAWACAAVGGAPHNDVELVVNGQRISWSAAVRGTPSTTACWRQSWSAAACLKVIDHHLGHRIALDLDDDANRPDR